MILLLSSPSPHTCVCVVGPYTMLQNDYMAPFGQLYEGLPSSPFASQRHNYLHIVPLQMKGSPLKAANK